MVHQLKKTTKKKKKTKLFESYINKMTKGALLYKN
jgi:hypothetical protein